MPFRRHDARSRAQAGGVHLSSSSASFTSFSSSSSSTFPAAPPSNSNHSDIAAHPLLSAAPKGHLPPDTILPVPRSSSLVPPMGQVQSRSPSESADPPPPSPTVPVSSGSAGFRLKRVFGGRRKKSEDISPNAAVTLGPVPIGIGKSRSVLTPAATAASSSSAPKFPQQPSISAGPAYPTSSFTRHVLVEPPSVPPSKPLPQPLLPGSMADSPLPSDQRSSLISATPGVSAASETENTEAVANVMRRPKKRDSDHEFMKEDWRKSDSTMTSYYTVRPRSGASGGTRTPRPVSMAESLHSTNTVVPAGRRLSALLTEAEFIMTEEGLSHSSATPLSRKTSPSGSSRTRKRHSISLSFTSPRPTMSTPSSEGHSSSKPAFNRRPTGDVVTLSKTAANGIIGPVRTGDSQSVGSQIRGNLTALSAATTAIPLPQQPLPSQSQHGSLRQTAITVTSGLAPAAGFAMGFGKRAVERMGRAFGGLGSGHNASGHSPSSSSIASTDDFSRNASNVSLASHVSQTPAGKGKQRRTPSAPSGQWSVHTLSSTSTGQTDPESFAFTGPTLGACLRGPMHNNSGGFIIGGLVFGRNLKTCVNDTAIDAVRLTPPTADSSQSVSPVLHERRLPALVVRCVEHLMKWGVEEEGLFRISGRATHIAKLRSEFDTGADFDMLECAPGDLDPHAVASIFKTYLRELPEPILTHALNPYFEAAMLTETNVRKSFEGQAAPVRSIGRKGPSLPSGPQDGHSLRKPPSLSTLAMPNFSGMRPPSQALLNAFSSLLARLPQENRDLLRTVIDLINFVAQRKEIRMPLSNITVVLCPTLNMSPPILRVLCEAEGIWNGPPEGWEDIADLDSKRDNPDPVPDGQSSDGEVEQNLTIEPRLLHGDLNDQSSAMEPVIGAWDARAGRQAPSEGQDDIHRGDKGVGPALDDRASYVSAGDSRPSTPGWGKGSPLDPWLPPALTSSSDSLTTPSTSSEAPSIPQVMAPTPVNAFYKKGNLVPAIIPDFVRTSPQPADHIPVTFPGSETVPGTPSSLRHSNNLPSLPLLPSGMSSQSLKPTRMKRPSLTAIFSKKSVSSLRSSRLFSSSSSSSPYFDAQDSPSRSSPASLSSPCSISPSIISAPSSLPMRSSSSLPPVLNTSIDSSSLSLAIGLQGNEPIEAARSSIELCAAASRISSSSPQRAGVSLPSSPTSPMTPVTPPVRNKSKPAKLPLSQPEPLQPQLSDDSFVSVSSASSYHRLSLWKGNPGESGPGPQDNWARNVLNDLGWSPTAVEHSMTGKA
ncbi:hypothetical protein BJV74DRAFT_795355 [Russula compacta]|nr:hypothetical protein BJV74DRAFT_795355 [Russula compacta]